MEWEGHLISEVPFYIKRRLLSLKSKKVSDEPAPIFMVDLGQFLPGRAACGHLVREGGELGDWRVVKAK